MYGRVLQQIPPEGGHLPLGIPLTVLPAGPDICAITFGSLIYQFGEAATKLSIKNVFDAFYAFIMRLRIKLAF